LIAVDSSVWIAHFHNTTPERVRLPRSLFGQEELLVGDIVLMEVLHGAHDEPHAARLSRELHELEIVPMLGSARVVQVARNYRALRAIGHTVSKMPDLMITTYRIEHSHTLLHDDRDFEPIHMYLGLQVV
jgi:predicted nucleic acid-binding protein